MNRSGVRPSPYRVPVAGLLTWLLPGAGHIYIGDRVRGVILMVVIGATFWLGIAVGGVTRTVHFPTRPLWFFAQACAGLHPVAAVIAGKALEGGNATTGDRAVEEKGYKSYGRAEDVSVVYTAIAGMLNILAVFDVLVRAERPGVGRLRWRAEQEGGVAAGTLPPAFGNRTGAGAADGVPGASRKGGA